MAWYEGLLTNKDNGNLFDWVGEGFFGLVEGAAVGAGSYLAEKERSKNERKMYERRMKDSDDRHKSSSVGVDEYGASYQTLTGGMLTNGGLLTGETEQQLKI